MSYDQEKDNRFWLLWWLIAAFIIINFFWAIAWGCTITGREAVKAGLVEKDRVGGMGTLWGKP